MLRKVKNLLLSKMQPLGIQFFRKEFDEKPFRLLDVGAGNHAASFFARHFPHCEYYGIDISRNYNNDESDFLLMKGFWEMDLTKLQFDSIPDEHFDAIHMSHVIEHLYNGDLVMDGLLKKLKKGGVIYIEYPRFLSTKFPSMRETLNFFDDETHVRIYSLLELYNVFLRNGCRPIRGGVRRNLVNVLLMPLQLPRMKAKRGYLVGADFWDLMGFAQFIFSKKA